MNAPQTTKEAAIKLILGEMGPILDRTEKSAKDSKESHDLIVEDIRTFGSLVTRLENTLAGTMDQVTFLLEKSQQVRIQTPQIATPVKEKPSISTLKLSVIVTVACLVSALASAGFVLVYNAKTSKNAQIGEAVVKALPYIDAKTRQNLEAAMQKTSQ